MIEPRVMRYLLKFETNQVGRAFEGSKSEKQKGKYYDNPLLVCL